MMRDISLHIMDIMQNSIKAGAKCIEITLKVDRERDLLCVSIKDDGCGMDEEFVKKVISPFTTTRTTRAIGLGVPMFKQTAEMTGGEFSLKSKVGKGTEIAVNYIISSIDRLPLGDVGDTIINTVLSYPELRYKLETEEFMFDTEEVKQKLGDVKITEFEVINWLREYINEGIGEALGGVLPELGK